MKSTAFTIKAFAVYVTLTGVTLMFSPNTLLGLLAIPETQEIWIRIVGILATVLGYYYWVCGTANATVFFAASVWARLFFLAGCIALVVLEGAPRQLLVFGATDAAFAAWTYATMRRR